MNRYKYVKKEYTVAQVAYLAGIIDGEGSIYIGNFSSNKKTGTKYYQTNIEITNTSHDLMLWIVDTFGGRLHTYTPKQMAKNSRRTVYRWIATGERVSHICELILRYVQAKVEQVTIMMCMRKTFDEYGAGMVKGKQGTQPLDPVVSRLRQYYFEKMQELHCRNYKNKKT